MPERVTYFAIIDHRATREDPAGIARRRRSDERGFTDEALGRDLNWHFTPLIVEWERAESTPDLEEITEEEAAGIIERFRQRWAAVGD